MTLFIDAFWKALGVQPDERAVMRLLLLNSFFFGLSYVFS
jgi:hypothetical protein